MLTPVYTRQFERDIARMLKRGKDPEKIKIVVRKLLNNEALDARCRDHKLSGAFKERRDCHVEPDWLLIYRKTESEIFFERTGSHADIFSPW